MKVLEIRLLCFVISFVALTSRAQNSSLTAVGQSQLPQWLAKIPEGSEREYGFPSRQEMNHALLGQAIQMITVEQDTQKNYRIQYSREWRIPVLCHGDFRTLLSLMERADGGYEAVGIGGHRLAIELQSYVSLFANSKLYLLRLYSSQMDFLVVVPSQSSIEQGIYYPLESAQQKIVGIKSLSLHNNYTYTQFIAILHQIEDK